MDKKEIRKYIKQKRLSLLDSEKIIFANSVFAKIEAMDCFKQACNILLYYSLPDELPTTNVIDIWSKTKNIFLPRVNGNELEILKYQRESMSIGAFNIEEPIGNELINLSEIDLIIVPGVAFDKVCNRLGRGKGYYDRLLSTKNIMKIGIGYDFQILESLPVEPHDVPLNFIVSPSNIFKRDDTL